MGYEVALGRAWEDLLKLNPAKNLSVKFLADDYSVDLDTHKVLSLSCNTAAKDFLSILILHYLQQKLKGLPAITNQWLTFRELSGVQGYYDAFHSRAIEPIIRKYGKNPDALKGVLERLPAKIDVGGDVSIVVQAFENIPVLIKLWKADLEFKPDANIYFDASIKDIFCTEDIVVLAQMISAQI